MLIDLHVHSHHTTGCTLAPRSLVRRAKEVGLDGVVLTDLNTLEGLEEIRSAGREEGLLALCGLELATDRGHYLCFFPDPSRTPAPPQIFGSAMPWPVRDVLAKVREMGGVVVAAHPYDKTIERPSGDVIFTLDGLCAIEAADHMSLPCVGASGAHELSDIGKAATLFRDPVTSEADLVAQLRSGTVFSVAIGVTPGAAPGSDRGERRDRRDGDRDRGVRRGGDRDRGGRRGGRGQR